MLNISPSGHFIAPTSVPYDAPSVSTSPGLTHSRFPSQSYSKYPPDKTGPDTLSHPSILRTTTTATKKSTSYHSKVQNSIIVTAPALPPLNHTGSFTLHIKYYWSRNATLVFPLVKTTRFLSIDPFLTLSLIPFMDTK